MRLKPLGHLSSEINIDTEAPNKQYPKQESDDCTLTEGGVMRANLTVLRIAQYILLIVFLFATSSTPSAKSVEAFRLYGVVEDGGRNHRVAVANEKTRLICETGFNAVRHTVGWVQGQKSLNFRDQAALRNAIQAARECGLTVILTVYPYYERALNAKPPATSSEQGIFADFVKDLAQEFSEVKHFEIGNEPNWSFFWWPQFGPDGRDTAIRSYFRLLARTYDKLKTLNSEIVVIGGALASAGEDDPNALRKRHSPTRSIELLGEYYRESGRSRPIMDWISIHPYPERPGEPPDKPHMDSTTIGFADYPKLVNLLGEAFDGTAQPGSEMPILYSEYGVDSEIPPAKTEIYRGKETSRPVPEEVQASYYRQAFELAACQPTVVGLLLFLAVDEKRLDRWQSGIYYGNNEPKTSQPLVKAAIERIQKGGIKC
ncbi:MAG: cellulase family glycosylhydrolase [bacterium]|nr:cellulase family glycosylhydrolase [bacterium]